MILKAFSAALFAVALATVPAERASADAGDVVGGLIVGGLIGAAIANGNRGSGNQGTSGGGGGIPATEMGSNTQTALNYFGFDAGVVDGQIGQGTRGAIEHYQATMGYPVNGRDYPSYQYDQLMAAYQWGLHGGQAQTGLYGQPLLIAYRSQLMAPTQPVQPQVTVAPPAQTTIVQPPTTAVAVTPVPTATSK